MTYWPVSGRLWRVLNRRLTRNLGVPVDAFSQDSLIRIGRLIEMGVATGVAALTITRSRPLRPVRDWVRSKSDWWGELISCPYCMAHWVAAVFSIWSFATWGRPRPITGVLIWLVTVGLGSVSAKSIYLAIIVILPTKSEGGERGKPEIIPKAAA